MLFFSILYADKITDLMRKTINETNRRRKIQKEYNEEHNITPQTIFKSVEEIMSSISIAELRKKDEYAVAEPVQRYMSTEQKKNLLQQMEEEMLTASKELEFELAATLRDEIEKLKKMIK